MRYKIGILFLLVFQLAFCVSQDSIGVVEQNGKKYILHLVGKETLFSISRRYNTSLNDLKNLNPELSQGLKMGQKLLVPIKEKTQKTETALAVSSNENYILHQVEASQTLYAISKKYNAKIDDIKRWNNLETNELKVGSYIIVGEKNKTEIVENVEVKKEIIEPKKEKTEPTQNTVTKKSDDGKTIEKTTATIFETTDGTKFFFALHKTAPAGTIIKISNPQNSSNIFARVTGKLTANENGIKLSKIAFEKLELSPNAQVLVEYILP